MLYIYQRIINYNLMHDVIHAFRNDLLYVIDSLSKNDHVVITK